ncbi:Co2+/Mg2+ efflux protein ApaG [Candidatus Gillettellia adelgis]
MIYSPYIHIQVHSIYMESQSIPEEERYVFAYTITIQNLGNFNVQLLGRHWLITNGNNHKTEVKGIGVVGKMPLIPPRVEFQYTSAAILETPLATMEGHYDMIDQQGQSFRCDIPVFRLSIPSLVH